MSKLAHWQSEALSHDLPAQVGSQSQLNARQLVSCPQLLAAVLASDPAVTMVPLQRPPKRSVVSDWLRKQTGGQPIVSKQTNNGNAATNQHTESTSTANDVQHVDYGQPNDSKHIVMNTDLVNTDQQEGFDVFQDKKEDYQGNRNCNDDDDEKDRRSLLRRQPHRVSFLRQDNMNSVDLASEDDDENHTAAAAAAADDDIEDGSGASLCKSTEGKSPISDSSSALFGSQPNTSGLPKASFIDLEVPVSWKALRQSQLSDSSRCSGSVEFHPISTTTPKTPALASTPTTSAKSRQNAAVVNLSAISCSPITPRTTSDHKMMTGTHERSQSPSVEAKEVHDDDMVTVIPCSPLTPSITLDHWHGVKNRTGTGIDGCPNDAVAAADDDDDDVTVIPATPVTPTSSQPMENSSCGKTSSAGAEVQQDVDDKSEEVIIIPCSPVTPSTVSNQAVPNRTETNLQRIPRLKVFHIFAHNYTKLT